nr:unnamed protein product [Callosobruchus analis]
MLGATQNSRLELWIKKLVLALKDLSLVKRTGILLC